MRFSRKNPVPAEFELLYEFMNSLDLRSYIEHGVQHEGGDQLATLDQLELWMHRRGLLTTHEHLDDEAHRKALELRDALRSLIQLSPTERKGDAAALVNAAAANFPLIVQMATTGKPELQPLPGVGSSGLGNILAELQHAAETASLARLKMCASEECHWVFYDRSKPGTRRWCSSTLCGNRQKTRAYRRRQQHSGEAVELKSGPAKGGATHRAR
jgi:predicted RNA-binding Zn ribbon-like protein